MKAFVVTGQGGSGTRLIGEYFKILNYDLGNNINLSYDNLDLHTHYFDRAIKNPLNPSYYDTFKSIFAPRVNISYKNNNTIAIKSPRLHMFLPFLHKYCEEENWELKIIHVIRDAAYMINSLNQAQFVEYNHLFQKKYNNNFNVIEFWNSVNKRAIQLLNNLKIKHMVIFYDDFIKTPDTYLKKLMRFTGDEANLDEFSKKIRTFNKFRSEKMAIEKMPADIISKIREITDLINNTNKMQSQNQFIVA